METIGILVVGAGFLGAQRAAAAMAARGTTLIGVADIDLGRARAVASRYGVFAAESLEEGLALGDIDAVVVATPHADHVESVELALARGKHVLCEKPLAIDGLDTRRLAAQAEDAGLVLAVGFNHRFYPPIRDAVAIVDGGGVGRVESVRAEIGHHASEAFLRGWHTDLEVAGGGTLLDNGVHACDLIRRIAGEVDTVTGALRHDLTALDTCEREALGLFFRGDDVVAEMHSSWNLRRGYLTVEVRGDRGWLIAETAPWRLSGARAAGGRIARRYMTDRVSERLFRLRAGCERSLASEIEAFAGTIAGAGGSGGNAEDGCRATEMVLGLYEADRRRARVALAPNEGDREPRTRTTGVRGRTGGHA